MSGWQNWQGSESFRLGYHHAREGLLPLDVNPKTFFGYDYSNGYKAYLNEIKWARIDRERKAAKEAS